MAGEKRANIYRVVQLLVWRPRPYKISDSPNLLLPLFCTAICVVRHHTTRGEAMELFLFCVLSLIAHVSGQSLMHVLSTNSALSTLYKVVNGSSHLTSTFSSLKNFTLLAPSDNAFTAFQLQSGGLPSGNDLTAFLQYHVLDGIWHASSWSNVPLFLHTSLDNPAYSNVTGGQNVELVLDPQQNPRMISGNKTSSSVTSTVCT